MVEMQSSEAKTPVTTEQHRSNGRANEHGECERWQWKRWRNDENVKWWKKKGPTILVCVLLQIWFVADALISLQRM